MMSKDGNASGCTVLLVDGVEDLVEAECWTTPVPGKSRLNILKVDLRELVRDREHRWGKDSLELAMGSSKHCEGEREEFERRIAIVAIDMSEQGSA